MPDLWLRNGMAAAFAHCGRERRGTRRHENAQDILGQGWLRAARPGPTRKNPLHNSEPTCGCLSFPDTQP
eukprot:2391341-Rhodomonas_salina.1